MARKLRERLGMVNANPTATGPELKVPDADKAGALVDAAESGFAAIQTLFADRNRSVELAQELHRRSVYLTNVNNGLVAQLRHAQLERDYLMKCNARLQAYLAQASDLFSRIGSEIGQVKGTIENMPSRPTITNDPDAPPLGPNGLPLEEQHFDEDGMPLNNKAHVVSNGDIQTLLKKLDGLNEAATVAAAQAPAPAVEEGAK